DVHVGARIRLRRTLLGISQVSLAEMIGLTFQQVQKYERRANRVRSSRMMHMANALDVSIAYFFEEMSSSICSSLPQRLSDRRAAETTSRAFSTKFHPN